jgi:hypothetical protein
MDDVRDFQRLSVFTIGCALRLYSEHELDNLFSRECEGATLMS